MITRCLRTTAKVVSKVDVGTLGSKSKSKPATRRFEIDGREIKRGSDEEDHWPRRGAQQEKVERF